MTPAFDPRLIFETLARHEVEYVTIGGVAVITRGVRRLTLDVDITPEPSSENLARLGTALANLAAVKLLPAGGRAPVQEADLATVALGTTLHTETEHGPLDIVGAPAGAADYPDLARRSELVSLGDIEIPIAGLDDLISMKRAAGRDTDLRDIAELTRA